MEREEEVDIETERKPLRKRVTSTYEALTALEAQYITKGVRSTVIETKKQRILIQNKVK